MPNQPGVTLGPNGECDQCGQRHLTYRGRIACAGHISSGSPRDDPKPRVGQHCRRDPKPGLTTCVKHGANTAAAKAVSAEFLARRKATAELERMLGDAGEAVTDPIGKLCAIAGRAVAFMEALGDKADDLDISDDQDRATIAIYGRSIKDAAQVVESIIRMGIAERFAKQNAEAVAAYVACLDAIVTDLGHNPRDPHVAGVIAKRLELVAS